MNNKYAFQGLKENMAKALVKDAEISAKASQEIASFIRGKTTEKAKSILNRVLEMKQAIPFRKYTDGVGHRAGANIGPGRFPQKAAKEFLKLIEAAEANAQAKGLSTDLKIVSLIANKGSNQFHYGRQSRRKYKRTHLEIVVEELEQKAEKKSTKKAVKKTPAKKAEAKPTPKKAEETKETKKEEKPVETPKETKSEVTQ